MKSFHDVVMRTGRLKVSSGTLFWHEAGEGTGVVFLHGSWYDSDQWLPVMQALASDYHCLAPDLIGFGESTSTATVHSIELEVEALHTLLQALRLSRAVLVGHSLGAWVALRYAQRYPDQVRGLVVVEPEGIIDPQGARRWRLDHWLLPPLLPLGALITLGSPLLSWLGWKGTLRTWQRRQHILRQAPAACQMLFRRRPAEIAAEQIHMDYRPTQTTVQFVAAHHHAPEGSALPPGVSPPLGVMQPIPANSTPLGLAEEPTITALRQALAAILLTPVS